MASRENTFWKRLMDGKDPLSIKRFIILIISAHFIIASFVTLFIAFYLVFYVPKGKVDLSLLTLLEHILYDDFMIIAGGLGLIGVENFGQAMIEKAKATASAVFSAPTVKADNVENVTIAPGEQLKSIKDEPKQE